MMVEWRDGCLSKRHKGIVCQTKGSPWPPISGGAVVLEIRADQEENRSMGEVNDINGDRKEIEKCQAHPFDRKPQCRWESSSRLHGNTLLYQVRDGVCHKHKGQTLPSSLSCHGPSLSPAECWLLVGELDMIQAKRNERPLILKGVSLLAWGGNTERGGIHKSGKKARKR